MARRGERTAAPVPGDPDDPSSWRCVVDGYLLALGLKARSPATIYGRRRSLARFAHWNLQHQRPRPLDITRSDVHDYEVALLHHTTSSTTPLAVRTREQYLIAIRGFYQWLHHHNRIATDPTSHTELPTPPIQLPPRILTTDDIDHVLTQPDPTTTLGRRDRTMLELLYATGIRRTELANLALDDIDLRRRSILIRHGKGGLDRLIPTGHRATRRLDHYLRNTRPTLANGSLDERTLFLTRTGTPICTAHLGGIIAKHLRNAGITNGSCHLFRHAMATHMLENGADLRATQTMLGHRNLASTQRYTHVSIQHLTHIHHTTHPNERATDR